MGGRLEVTGGERKRLKRAVEGVKRIGEETMEVVRASNEGIQARGSIAETERGECGEVEKQKQDGMVEFREKEEEQVNLRVEKGEGRREEVNREDRKILEEDLKNEMKNLENSRENKVSSKDNLMEIDRVSFNQEKKKEGL